MSPRINDGGPAFPSLESMESAVGPDYKAYGATGMSLRAYFAGQAMVSILTSSSANNESTLRGQLLPKVAEISCVMADALIAELNKPKEGGK